MRKKNNPGCPCCSYQFSCDCNATQTRIEITNAGDSATIQGMYTEENCSFLTFTGFSAINGVYYVDWPFDGGSILLGSWKASNGPLLDSEGQKWCLYAKLSLSVLSSTPCEGKLCLCFSKFLLLSGVSCPNEPSGLNGIPYLCFYPDQTMQDFCSKPDNPYVYNFWFCQNKSQTINQPTTDGLLGCDVKLYPWSVQSSPVLL